MISNYIKPSSLLLFISFLVFSLNGKEIILQETFDNKDKLLQNGWQSLSNCEISRQDGFQCIQINGRTLAFKYLKVIPGRRYVITCMMKSKDVKQGGKFKRGASLYAEWADSNKGYVTGGMFPKGRYGSSEWSPFVIEPTKAVPRNVRYIKLYLALEGSGKMWVRDLTVSEFSDFKPLKVLEPEDNAEFGISRPLLKWEKKPGLFELLIAPDKKFKTNIGSFIIGEQNEFRIPVFMKPRVWFWQVRSRKAGPDGSFATPVRKFVIKKDAELWPPLISMNYRYGADEIQFSIKGNWSLNNVKIYVDGKQVAVKLLNADKISCKLPVTGIKGLHKVLFRFAKRGKFNFSKTLYFNDSQTGTRVSFRNGLTYINGKAFFPIGAFRDPSDCLDNFAGLKEAGFNMTHSYFFEHDNLDLNKIVKQAEKYLSDAEINGLKVFLGIRRSWVRKHKWGSLRQYISRLMIQPALISWYLNDEPILNNVAFESMKKLNSEVKFLDPFHPTFVLFNNMSTISKSLKEYTEFADIIGTDPYPSISNDPVLMVEKYVKNSRILAGKDRPVWCVIEAFDAGYVVRGKKQYKNMMRSKKVTKPDYMRLRCMTFLALSAGADGIIFYWLPKYNYNIVEDAPKVWEGIRLVVKELNSLMPYLTIERSNGDFHILKSVLPLRIWSRKAADGTRILALINPGETKVKKILKFSADNKEIYENSQRLKLDEGGFTVEMKPYEVKIFEIKNEKATD